MDAFERVGELEEALDQVRGGLEDLEAVLLARNDFDLAAACDRLERRIDKVLEEED